MNLVPAFERLIFHFVIAHKCSLLTKPALRTWYCEIFLLLCMSVCLRAREMFVSRQWMHRDNRVYSELAGKWGLFPLHHPHCTLNECPCCQASTAHLPSHSVSAIHVLASLTLSISFSLHMDVHGHSIFYPCSIFSASRLSALIHPKSTSCIQNAHRSTDTAKIASMGMRG